MPPLPSSLIGTNRFKAGTTVLVFLFLYPFLSYAGQDSGRAARSYVGSGACMTCHGDQGRQWQDSHHAKAMQPADAKTVLGNFDGAEFSKDGFVSRFFRRAGKYYVRTDGHGGKLADYEIRYTFGVFPLQQYLIEIPGGRLQALGIAWDARPKAEGGQRWYHLYPDRKLKAGDPLHWSGRDQNWNFMCASCHTTGLHKNFDLATNTFKTTWAESGVACESCHGAGSAHVAWAQGFSASGGRRSDEDNGLVSPSNAAKGVLWKFDTPGQRIASPHGDVAAAKAGLDACFACHSRRREITAFPDPSQAFLDNFLPSLLDRGLYHADGQIDDEAFEFGSFAQSRMHQAGVACINCHEAHSLKLRASGNALCLQCHNAIAYESEKHYHHPLGSSGAQCVNCHMPHKTYMGIDTRRDHSFRIPRPDLSVALRTPDACTQCHTDKAPQWAADAITSWTGVRHSTTAHAAAAIDAAWLASPAADKLLAALNRHTAQPGIVRATAIALQTAPASQQKLDSISVAAADSDALVRIGAARALATLMPQDAIRIGSALLRDANRAVRIEAARILAGSPAPLLSVPQATQLQLAIDELIQAELAAAERPGSHVNLAQIYFRLDKTKDAERELQTALRLDPRFVPAMVNLADLYRALGKDGQGEPWLRKAIAVDRKAAEPVHALGLLKIRAGDRAQAMPLLRKAADMAPQNAGYSFVYALALTESGASGQALSVIDNALRHSPLDASLLQARIDLERQLGKNDIAARHEAEYRRLSR